MRCCLKEAASQVFVCIPKCDSMNCAFACTDHSHSSRQTSLSTFVLTSLSLFSVYQAPPRFIPDASCFELHQLQPYLVTYTPLSQMQSSRAPYSDIVATLWNEKRFKRSVVLSSHHAACRYTVTCILYPLFGGVCISFWHFSRTFDDNAQATRATKYQWSDFDKRSCPILCATSRKPVGWQIIYRALLHHLAYFVI